jgi:type VI secretion system secreted protein Hcp
MPYYASISLKGRRSNSKGGPVHEMKYGPMSITPRNLDSALFQVKSQCNAGSGALVGRRKHSPITIVREVDSASPLLWQGLCTNESLQEVDISLVGRPPSGGGEVVVERITLTNAVISNVHRYTPHLGSSQRTVNDTNELEEIEFTFQKITYTNVAGSKSTKDDWFQYP